MFGLRHSLLIFFLVPLGAKADIIAVSGLRGQPSIDCSRSTGDSDCPKVAVAEVGSSSSTALVEKVNCANDEVGCSTKLERKLAAPPVLVVLEAIVLAAAVVDILAKCKFLSPSAAWRLPATKHLMLMLITSRRGC